MLKDMDFSHLPEFFLTNIKNILDAGLHALKTASIKLVHKTSEFIRNKITDKIVKSKHVIVPP